MVRHVIVIREVLLMVFNVIVIKGGGKILMVYNVIVIRQVILMVYNVIKVREVIVMFYTVTTACLL